MALLGWPEEVFFRRLMSIVDDYGRYEANPQLLRSRCYPLQTDAVRVTDITRWLAACQTAGVILYYAVLGKQYLEVINFQQQQRSASKYPPLTSDDAACNHLLAHAHLGVSVVVSVVDKKPTALSPAKLPTCPTSEIINLYHAALPELPSVRLHTKSRVKAIRTTWDWVMTSKKTDHSRRAETADDALKWFKNYFERASNNDFLMGRGKRSDDHQNWQCDLDFLLTEKGMKQVIEKTKETA